MNSIVKQNLEWLFHFNKDKNDFINFINARGGNWAKSLSELIQNLKRKGAQGIQDKFRNLGFNTDYAYIQLKPLFCELEVGDFMLDKGEKVIFLEGQNSPDMISGIKKFDKVWEISTVFDSPEIKNLWIEANKIIKRWKTNVKCDIKLSLNLSGFQPKKSYHKNFDKIVNNSLKELKKFDPIMLNLDEVIKIGTPMIYFELMLSSNSFSGISTMQEGAIEKMAFLETQEHIESWVSQFKSRIIKKSNQIINDIQKIEANGTNKWEKDNNRIIALVSDADIFYDKYFSQTCFGSMDIHITKYINDPRVIKIQHSNPWCDYIKKHYFDDYGDPLKEPKGVFLCKETEDIHGVLFISSNRRPIDHKFLANPFVLKNNNTGIIKYLP